MVDSTKLGTTAAECMESLDRDHADGSVVTAVMMIVIVEPPDGAQSRTRTYCSEHRYWMQQGIMKVGQECLDSGERRPGIGEDDEEEEDGGQT